MSAQYVISGAILDEPTVRVDGGKVWVTVGDLTVFLDPATARTLASRLDTAADEVGLQVQEVGR